MLNLAGEWSLAQANGENAVPFSLPGDGIDALFQAGAIPDPYFGRNEYGLRWICDRTWVAKRNFVTDRTDLMLVASMLDTLVTVAVNGTVVLTSDNMFLSHRVDLSAVLVKGQNDISLTFGNVPAEAKRRQDAYRFFLPFSINNTPIHNGNLIRKPACDFGWDWNIALATFGVYGDLHLEPAAPSRIDHLVITQTHSPGLAVVSVTAEVEGDDGQEVTFDLCGVQAKAVVRRGQAKADLAIANPALWWPAGQGAQPLHDLTVTMGAQVLTRRIGLRVAELITEKDAVGLGFKVRINGRDIFCKGEL